MFWGSSDAIPLREPADWVESVKGVADKLLVAATFWGNFLRSSLQQGIGRLDHPENLDFTSHIIAQATSLSKTIR